MLTVTLKDAAHRNRKMSTSQKIWALWPKLLNSEACFDFYVFCKAVADTGSSDSLQVLHFNYSKILNT